MTRKQVPLAYVQALPPEIQPTNGINFKCTCGADVFAATEPQPVVLHPLPMCKDFEELDPSMYMAHCRQKLGA